MKTSTLTILAAVLALVPAAHAQKTGTEEFPHRGNTNPPPPKVWEASVPPQMPAVAQPKPAAPPPGQVYVYDQKPVGGRPVLIEQDQAQSIINHFRETFPKLNTPRMLIYVNRDLVDEQSGMKLTQRTERVTKSIEGTNGTSAKVVGENTFRTSGKAEPTLADKQTVRDVERLFGRPLRAGGVSLADQKVASQLMADKPLEEFLSSTDTPQARKDREALGKVADGVIEILISSKNITTTTISGSQQITIPDIQATAIRLNDSKILGQVSSSDVTGRVPPNSLASFDVRDIAEVTALELMDDMTRQ